MFNKKAKKVVALKYKVKSKAFLWNSDEYFEFSRDELKRYLKKQNLFNKNKLETLISLLNKRVEQNKARPFLLPGLFIALLIPIWDKVLNLIYNDIKSANELIFVTLILLAFALIIVLAVSMLRSFIHEIKNDVFDEEIETMKVFTRRLEELLLEVPDENIEKTREKAWR